MSSQLPKYGDGRPRVLGVFALTTMGVAAILALRNLPIAAMYGLSSVTFFILAALIFFIPSAYVCANLAKALPKAGGLYAWVKQAFGPKLGFLAIWLEWINTVVSFPMMIGFIIFTLLFPFFPQLASNKSFEFCFMLLVFWGVSIINFFGIRASSWFSSICVIIGTLVPAIVIISLGFYWLLSGHPSQIHFSTDRIWPDFRFGTLAFLVAIVNGFSGIQITAFHARETKQPRKTFPIATTLTVVIILMTYIFATLAIAMVMPPRSSSIIGGLISSLSVFLKMLHMPWLIPVIAAAIAIGVLSEINAWIIGPSKGMFAAAKAKQLPQLLARENRRGVPVAILILQAVLGSLLGLTYIFMPSVNSAYWLLSDLTGQFTLLMWLLVFSSAIYLSYFHLKRHKAQLLRHGSVIIAGGLGALISFSIFMISYIPPTPIINHDEVMMYEAFLLTGMLVFLLLPLIGLTLKRKNMTTGAEERT